MSGWAFDPALDAGGAGRIRPTRRRGVERAPLPPGASLVETIPYTLTHRLLREVLEHRGCLEISGEGGTGKTFTVDDFFAQAPHDVVKIHIPTTIRGYGFLRTLVRELGGVPEGDGERLIEALREAVGARRVYVYVDEADNLNGDSLRVIRYLRDQLELGMAFVLVGANFPKAYRRVPELWSRVTRRVTFARLEGAALTAALAAYHPFLATADPALLLRIDDEHPRGNWRTWSIELQTLLAYAARLGEDQLTPAVAAAALGVTADPHGAYGRGSRARRSHRGAGR